MSSMIVCVMCPIMSLLATCLFMHPGKQVIALWLQKVVQNFPMALCWQIFYAGPAVRNLMKLFEKKSAESDKPAESAVSAERA